MRTTMINRRNFLKAAGAAGAAGLLAACGGSSSAASSTAASTASSAAAAAPAAGDVDVTLSWWGGESRHVAYLESIYGKDWADPATSTLNYTREEVAEGLDFIKSLVDRHVVMPLPEYYGNNGSTSASQSTEWITGKIAGILWWTSCWTAWRAWATPSEKRARRTLPFVWLFLCLRHFLSLCPAAEKKLYYL